jgi:hypothetical protein
MHLSHKTPPDSAPLAWARKVFVMAGMANIMTILVATRAFTDSLISEVDPAVFSTPGLILIMIWGFAYLAVAPHWRQLPQMCLVFMLEKLVYVVMWTLWMLERRDQLQGLWEINWQIALFYGGYGLVDAAFTIFFFWAWTQARTRPE